LPHYIEYVCHSSAITCLQINNDATHIFTASDDGNILVFYFNHNSAKNNSNYDSNILDNNSNYINANS
jgi:6-phosphogluconolactonase (cycloisomerase 2 family)